LNHGSWPYVGKAHSGVGLDKKKLETVSPWLTWEIILRYIGLNKKTGVQGSRGKSYPEVGLEKKTGNRGSRAHVAWNVNKTA